MCHSIKTRWIVLLAIPLFFSLFACEKDRLEGQPAEKIEKTTESSEQQLGEQLKEAEEMAEKQVEPGSPAEKKVENIDKTAEENEKKSKY